VCNHPDLETETTNAPGRGRADRPTDPLFPLLPRVLETIRAKVAERVGRGGEEVGRDEYARIVESICGAVDDSQAIEQYDGTLGVTAAFTAQHQSAVGQIQWNDDLATIYTNPGNVNDVRWCSGTMISNDLFLTAGHCFDQTGGGWERPRINNTNNIIPSTEIATRMHVNFNYQDDPAGNPRPVTSVAIVALVEYRLGGLDFAIVRLAGNPGAVWGQAQISTTDAAAGDMLCIMGHPNGVPKRVEAGPALAPSGSKIRYDDIDTLGGNSGSGVLRASDGRLVGVHTNGGCGPTSPNGTDYNFGQRIVSLIAASPTLKGLTNPLSKFVKDHHATHGGADVPKLKFADDPVSFKFADDPGTALAQDLGGPLKMPADVKMLGFDKRAGSDGFQVDPSGPFVHPSWGTARPLILQAPHHSQAWLGVAGGGAAWETSAAQYESALLQLGQAIGQRQAEIEQMDQQYRVLLSEYQRASGQAT
jgi:V8-like Glu-specific endopeptidase